MNQALSSSVSSHVTRSTKVRAKKIWAFRYFVADNNTTTLTMDYLEYCHLVLIITMTYKMAKAIIKWPEELWS